MYPNHFMGQALLTHACGLGFFYDISVRRFAVLQPTELSVSLLDGAVNRCYKKVYCHFYAEAYLMQTKFSEDVVPLSDLKVNPGKIVNRAKDTHRPILLTSRGRGIAVVQGLDEYEKNEEEREFMKAIAQGLMDIRDGRELELDEVRMKLGMDK